MLDTAWVHTSTGCMDEDGHYQIAIGMSFAYLQRLLSSPVNVSMSSINSIYIR